MGAGYVIGFEGQTFDPHGPVTLRNGVAIQSHNEALERAELDHWSGGPDRWHGYIEFADPGQGPQTAIVVKTWLGSVLASGRITGVSRGFHRAKIYRVQVRGTNGKIYVGQSGGMFTRLRAVK